MNKFADMSTSQLLEIINLKNENISSYEDIQAARDEYINRISRELHEIKPEKVELVNETQTAPQIKEEKTQPEVYEKREPVTVLLNTAPQKIEHKKRTKKKSADIAPLIFNVGILIFFADAFLTFLVSVLNAVLNYSLLVNVSVLAAAAYLGIVFFGCYSILRKGRSTALIWRSIALSHIILALMTPGINVLGTLLLIAFLISALKNNLSL